MDPKPPPRWSARRIRLALVYFLLPPRPNGLQPHLAGAVKLLINQIIGRLIKTILNQILSVLLTAITPLLSPILPFLPSLFQRAD